MILERRTLILFLTFFLFGCVETKKFVYFNNLDPKDSLEGVNNLRPILIQSGDVIQVTVTTLDRDVSALLNPTSTTGGILNNQVLTGYIVDVNGYIEMPVAGKVFVKGKSTADASQAIKQELSKTINNVFVSSRLLNFRISVLGDVARPGSFNITNERVSILDALSMAGDLNLTAVRDDVLLIRDVEGKKTYVSINLNDSKTLSSPYFYLANNDVVYIKPGAAKVFGNTSAFRLFPYITSAVSILLVIYATLIRN